MSLKCCSLQRDFNVRKCFGFFCLLSVWKWNLRVRCWVAQQSEVFGVEPKPVDNGPNLKLFSTVFRLTLKFIKCCINTSCSDNRAKFRHLKKVQWLFSWKDRCILYEELLSISAEGVLNSFKVLLVHSEIIPHCFALPGHSSEVDQGFQSQRLCRTRRHFFTSRCCSPPER